MIPEFTLEADNSPGRQFTPEEEKRMEIMLSRRYADWPKPPQPMPSGWAALLYLYDLR
ncbi:MAG: hypothetical protein QOJ40_2785 [Verrucomicrobiota bacterium]